MNQQKCFFVCNMCNILNDDRIYLTPYNQNTITKIEQMPLFFSDIAYIMCICIKFSIYNVSGIKDSLI